MNINFATALISHEIEDRVIEVLCGTGFTLLFRAVTIEQLTQHLNTSARDDRLVIVTEEKAEVQAITKIRQDCKETKVLLVSNLMSYSKDELVSAFNSVLRYSVSEKQTIVKGFSKPSWIAVTGTSSSPGATSIALNVASELAQSEPCSIVDANSHNKDLHVFLGTRCAGESALSPTLFYLGISDERDQETLNSFGSRRCVLDVGPMPRFDSYLMTDRRQKTRETLDLIFESQKIIYVLQPHHRSLKELEDFLEFADQELISHELTFVLNKVNNSQRGRLLVKNLKNRIGGRPHFLVPRDDTLFERAQSRYASISEVGTRTHVRKALQEISVYLFNST